ncbi:MAG: DUF4468 domain-containing protein [Bacteroidia bacterium]|nr:DUF4468 domain-containing protein [Bacteroidia bacterium]
MKNHLLTLLVMALLLPVILPAQDASLPRDAKSGLISYSAVKEVAGTNSAALYQRAIGWASAFYKNPADVIRERDSSGGKIVCKARFKIANPADKKGLVTDAGNVMYTLSIQFKDGRYRYEMTAFNWKQPSYFACEKWMDKTSASYLPVYESYLQQTTAEAIRVLNSLEKALSTAAAENKDDW